MIRIGRRGLALAVMAFLFSTAAVAAQTDEEWTTPEVREVQLGERVIRMGTWGADVFTLQRSLRRLGYEVQADGIYGPQTRDAVRSFQQLSGIRDSGVIDAETLEALNLALLRHVESFEYVVQPGDSLWVLAQRFDTTMETLVAINDLPPGPLRIGQTLKIPALIIHTVRPGDTLWEIARRYGTTIEGISRLNNLDPSGVLTVGLRLYMPRGSVQPPPE